MKRFFTKETKINVGKSISLTAEESKHLIKVLRFQKGDRVEIFNHESAWETEITIPSAKGVTVTVLAENIPQLRKYHVTLALALIKLPNFELALQKATELGVDEIIPLTTEFSQIKIPNWEKKQQRWERIILDACKQSHTSAIPILQAPNSFQSLMATAPSDQLNIMLTLGAPNQQLTLTEAETKIGKSERIMLLVGPEGGFSPHEHQLLPANIFTLQLPGNILRTETAVITALSIVNFIKGKESE